MALVSILLLFHDAFLALHVKWAAFNQSYSHGYLILLIAIYWLVTEERRKLKPGYPAIMFAFTLVLIWYFGWATQTLIFQQGILPLVLLCFYLAAFGTRAAIYSSGAFLFLYLAIPFWDVFQPYLRLATSTVVQHWIYWVGIPAFVDGFTIELPYGVLKVAGSCAGLNFFLMGLVIGLIYVSRMAGPLWLKVALVLFLLLISIIANWIRVFLLVLIGYYSEMQSGIVYDHGMFGWVIFAIALFFFFFAVHFLLKMDFFVRLTRLSVSSSTVEATDVNDTNENKLKGDEQGICYRIIVIYAAVFCILAFPVFVAQNKQNLSNAAVDVSNNFTHNWSEIEHPEFNIGYVGWDKSLSWYNNDNPLAEMTAYIYFYQMQGKEMIHSDNKIASENQLIRQSTLQAPEGSLQYRVVRGARADYLVVFSYRVGNQFAPSALSGKILQFFEALRGNTTAALLTYTLKCSRRLCEREQDYVEENSSDVSKYLLSTNWLVF